jgi:branched-chain amino acid transport system substrate-binding protein
MKTRVRCSAILAAVVLAVSACGGPGAAGGASDGPIKVGILADLTGATADVGTPYNQGMLDYIDWRNADGGIEGRKIEPDSNDYAYKVPAAEELYKRYVSEGSVVIQGWGTSDSEALRGKVAADELPFMSGSLSDIMADPAESPYTFVPFATYNDQMRVAIDWIAKDAGGPAAVAVFHIDSPAGSGPFQAAQEWVSEKKYPLTLEPYPMPDASTFVALLAKAREQGAKYVVVQHVSTPAAQVAKDLFAQGGGMRMVCLSICADEFFVQTAGQDAAEGQVMINPVSPPSVERPGHRELADYLESKGKSLDDQNVHYVQGWFTMHVMSLGIEKVLKDGQELTGANIKKALEELDTVDTGEVTGPVDFTGESHSGTAVSGLYQVKGGKLTELEPAAKPAA